MLPESSLSLILQMTFLNRLENNMIANITVNAPPHKGSATGSNPVRSTRMNIVFHLRYKRLSGYWAFIRYDGMK